MDNVRIGIVGGSGLYDMAEVTDRKEVRLSTPFGDPSDAYVLGTLRGKRVAFLPRHGVGHRFSPSELNYRANIFGFKMLGVEYLLSASAVGSLKELYKPLDIVIPDQFFDRTKGRISTFFGKGLVAHVGFAHPFCRPLSALAQQAGAGSGATIHAGGTYVCMEGPQFSTLAESQLYRSWGMDIIGMTNLQEAKLAREAEICYATIALVTDYDCWHPDHDSVTVEMVIANLVQNARTAQHIIAGAVERLPFERTCECATALKHALITRPETVPAQTRQDLAPLVSSTFPHKFRFMTKTRFEVTAVGNAIVDVFTQADDALLVKYGLVKGAMSLIDAGDAERLYAIMGPGVEISGGSAANTVAAVAALGGRTAYIGKVADDQLGNVFEHDIRAIGVTYDTPRLSEGLSTARCLVFVTPDAQRTMQTFLGATTQLGPEDINLAYITASKVLYLEGYLWDQPRAKAAMRDAAIAARRAGVKVALTLSDAFCVARFRDEFLELVNEHVDILFANEAEVLSLYQVDRFDDALQQVRGQAEIAALTRSEKGSVVVHGSEVHVIDAVPDVAVVDTTGAGDAYAGGFLHGFTQGHDLATCGRLGGALAAHVISQVGARPTGNLENVAARVLESSLR